MTTGEYLLCISKLDTGTAIEHLMSVREVYYAVKTGELLSELSPLQIATALQHLLAICQALIKHINGGGLQRLPDIENFEDILEEIKVEMPKFDLDRIDMVPVDLDSILDNDITKYLDNEITSTDIGI